MTEVQWTKCACHVGVEHRADVPCPKCEPVGGRPRTIREISEGIIMNALTGYTTYEAKVDMCAGEVVRLTTANNETLAENDKLRAEVRALRAAMVTKPNERPVLVCDNEWE